MKVKLIDGPAAGRVLNLPDGVYVIQVQAESETESRYDPMSSVPNRIPLTFQYRVDEWEIDQFTGACKAYYQK